MNWKSYTKKLRGLHTIEDKKKVSELYHSECKEVLNKIIVFLGSKIKEDKLFKDYVQECWDYIKDQDEETYEEWFNESYFSELNEDCMKDFLGYVFSKGRDFFNDYMINMGFVEFVESVKGDKFFEMGYSEGHCGFYKNPKVCFIIE